MSDANEGLSSVRKAFDVLKALKEQDGMRVSEVSEELDMPMSTAHSHLSTLVDLEFATMEGDIYIVGTAALELGEYIKYRRRGDRLAEKYTQQLRRETGYRTVYMIEEHGRGVYLHTDSGEHPSWEHERAGEREPLHTVAAGKAILAELPKRRADEIVDERGLVERTGNTITDRDELETELEEIRERGYALNDEENIEGVRAIGAAVHGRDGRVIGSFSVSGAANRMTGDEFRTQIPETVLAVTNEYELDLSIGD